MTGASDGIGKSYALELAKEGFNIILMARSKDKTEAVAKEVRDTHSVQTKVIIFDFGKLNTTDEIVKFNALVEQNIADLDVSILVNNVGFAAFGLLNKLSTFDMMNSVCVNNKAQPLMTSALIQRLHRPRPCPC